MIKKTFNQKLLGLCIVLAGSVAVAAVAPITAPVTPASKVLTFKTWKEQQVMKAQNIVVRLANQILIKNNSLLSGQEPEVTTESTLNNTEGAQKNGTRDLKLAQQDLQIATELEFEDYLSVLLSQLGDNPKRLKELAKQLSTDEVAKTLLYLQRYKSAPRSTVIKK